VCLDAGGTLGPVNIVADLVSYQYSPYSQSLVSTNVADCMRHHLAECVEFIADLHTINKVKVQLIYLCTVMYSEVDVRIRSFMMIALCLVTCDH